MTDGLRARQMWHSTEDVRLGDDIRPGFKILEKKCGQGYVRLENFGWREAAPVAADGTAIENEEWVKSWSSKKGSFTTWIKTILGK